MPLSGPAVFSFTNDQKELTFQIHDDGSMAYNRTFAGLSHGQDPRHWLLGCNCDGEQGKLPELRELVGAGKSTGEIRFTMQAVVNSMKRNKAKARVQKVRVGV